LIGHENDLYEGVVNARDPGPVPVNSEAEELAIAAITRMIKATATYR